MWEQTFSDQEHTSSDDENQTVDLFTYLKNLSRKNTEAKQALCLLKSIMEDVNDLENFDTDFTSLQNFSVWLHDKLTSLHSSELPIKQPPRAIFELVSRVVKDGCSSVLVWPEANSFLKTNVPDHLLESRFEIESGWYQFSKGLRTEKMVSTQRATSVYFADCECKEREPLYGLLKRVQSEIMLKNQEQKRKLSDMDDNRAEKTQEPPILINQQKQIILKSSIEKLLIEQYKSATQDSSLQCRIVQVDVNSSYCVDVTPRTTCQVLSIAKGGKFAFRAELLTGRKEDQHVVECSNEKLIIVRINSVDTSVKGKLKNLVYTVENETGSVKYFVHTQLKRDAVTFINGDSLNKIPALVR